MTEILVTGGLGFIGSHLCERLLDKGYQVFCVDNGEGSHTEDHLDLLRRRPGFNWIAADIVALASFPRLPDVVIHLAAKAGVRASMDNPRGYVRTNVQGTTNVLELCREAGVPRMLLASSSSVYGHPVRPWSPSREDDRLYPLSAYGVSKMSAEQLCLVASYHYGMQCTALRFFSVYGPRQRPDLVLPLFARQMLAGEAVTVLGDASSQRDYTYITDICDGIILALDRMLETPAPGTYECFNLGSGTPITLGTLIDTLQTALGICDVAGCHDERHPADVAVTWADISKARAMLGYAPQVLFTEGVQRYVDWLRAGRALAHATIPERIPFSAGQDSPPDHHRV